MSNCGGGGGGGEEEESVQFFALTGNFLKDWAREIFKTIKNMKIYQQKCTKCPR